MSTRLFARVLLAVGLVPLGGCAEKVAEVSGTVTLKGKPLSAGVVTFFPESGTPVAAFVQGGSYSIPATGFGSYRITVAPAKEQEQVTQVGGRTMKPGEVDPTAKAAPPPKKSSDATIPARYQSVDQSGLSCSVDRPKVTHPITLD